MRNFLKSNLLSILVCLITFCGLSFASTLTRPYGASDYAGGAKAVGAKVNSEFDTIVNWLNGGNIESGNIASLGVATANLANGSVTNIKRGSANVTVSTSSSLFQNTGALANVTNLTAAITTFGRPVLVRLEPAGTAYLVSNVSTTIGAVYASNSSGQGSYLTIVKDSSTLVKQPIAYMGASSERFSPCSSFSYLDTPVAGTYTYKIAVESESGVTATVSGCRLSVVEF